MRWRAVRRQLDNSILDILRQQLYEDLRAGTKWCVALSGGVDSMTLLHALVRLTKEFGGNTICAVHVNHHLHADADLWAGACQLLCNELDVPLTCCDVAVKTGSAAGLEAAARKMRYGALSSQLAAGEILLTAHHQDDQVETLLLRLLRGAGPHGLASIEPRRSYGKGWLVRPWLDVGRTALEAYAREQQLEWIEDPSNIDTTFDRNFLRHRVLPVLRERWPGLSETIPRAARLSGEAARMLDDLAQRDISVTDANSEVIGSDKLPLAALRDLPAPRQRNVVRYWLRQRGLAPPAEVKLRHGLEQLLSAGPDRMPLVAWGRVQLRRYRDHLYVLEFDPRPDDDSIQPPGADGCDWDGCGRKDLGPLRGRLRFMRQDGVEIDVPMHWMVRFRSGGERFAVGGQHKTIRNLFQERGVVPWMRDHIPLLYRADQLVAVGDLWCAHDIGADDARNSVQVVWDGHPSIQ